MRQSRDKTGRPYNVSYACCYCCMPSSPTLLYRCFLVSTLFGSSVPFNIFSTLCTYIYIYIYVKPDAFILIFSHISFHLLTWRTLHMLSLRGLGLSLVVYS